MLNIACIICSDLFTPLASIYITPCGHLFHYACLLQWFDRAKTCPQCRTKISERSLIRVFPNVSSAEGINEDAVTLQAKIDNLQLQVKMKEKDIKTYRDKASRLKEKNDMLRGEIQDLEQKERVRESAINALKEQISFFKKKSNESDRLCEEIAKLKSKLKKLEDVQMVIEGSREQVVNMLRHNNDPEALNLLVHTLKKALMDADKKKIDLQKSMKYLQDDSIRYRKRSETLEGYVKTLKSKIESLQNTNSRLDESRLSISPNVSSSCIEQLKVVNNFIEQSKAKCILPASTISPALPEKIKHIQESQSPYLKIKSSSMGISLSFAKERSHPTTHSSFLKPSFKIADAPKSTTSDNHPNVTYDGLGGHRKDDIFPSPKQPCSKNLKRHRSTSTVSSAKFKKLSSAAGNLNTFVNKS